MSIAQYLAPAALIPALIISSVGAEASVSYKKARVINVQPQYQTVTYSVPTEQCRVESVPVYHRYEGYPRRSYTAPIVGAIIGGAVGNAVVHGKSRKRVGTAVGAVLGASIGADVSRQRRDSYYADRPVSYRQEQVCETVDEVHEERELSGYEVKYRFAGETYVTLMDRDPGRFIRVRVDVTPV
jgi:uncharacterized protein YcfJ